MGANPTADLKFLMTRFPVESVMAGLVPAIYVLPPMERKDVDARHETGHDDSN
jgi:hypothetical protein